MKLICVLSVILLLLIICVYNIEESYEAPIPIHKQQIYIDSLNDYHQNIIKNNNQKKGLYYSNKSDEYELCKLLYDPNKRQKKISLIPKFFTKDECQIIIKEAEEYANSNKWSVNRHKEYPTTDNEITKKWYSYNKIVYSIYDKIIPEIVKLFEINPQIVSVNEIFISKYSMNGQKKLRTHRDGSEFSFIIALNDDYSGGGTKFENLNKTIEFNTGDCLVFCGQEKHKGIKITSGTRYIIAGFLGIIKNDDFCDKWAQVYTNLSESESDDDEQNDDFSTNWNKY